MTELIPLTAPWERRENETSKAYEAFCLYRDMGASRTQSAVAAEVGKSRTLVSKWAVDHGWTARTAAYDSIPVRAVADAYADMARRIAAQHEALATKLMTHLSRNLDLLAEGQDPTMRFSTALGAARQSHQFATELGKPKDDTKAEITRTIQELILRLAGDAS